MIELYLGTVIFWRVAFDPPLAKWGIRYYIHGWLLQKYWMFLLVPQCSRCWNPCQTMASLTHLELLSCMFASLSLLVPLLSVFRISQVSKLCLPHIIGNNRCLSVKEEGENGHNKEYVQQRREKTWNLV